MKKIILFLSILFFSPLVFAQDFNVSMSDVSSPNSSGSGKYTGTEIYNSGTSNVYNFGTRYNGRLSRIIFNLASGGYADPNGFEKGHTYTLSMNMATDDWRNKFGSVSVTCNGSGGAQLSNGKVTYVSYKKIKFSFTAPTNTYCSFVYVDLKSSDISSVAFTGVSNWNLSSLVISDPTYCSGSSCGGSTPTPSQGATNQDIINNQNNNTQNIVDNQNSNTNDIIENNNSNTDKQIENDNANADKKEYLDSVSNNEKIRNDNNNSLTCGSNLVSMTNYHRISNSTWTYVSSGSDFVRIYAANKGSSASFPIGWSFNVTANKHYYISFDTTNSNYNKYQIYLYKSGWSSGLYKYYSTYQNNIDFVPTENGTYYLQLYMLRDNKEDSDFYIRNLEVKECVNKTDAVNDTIKDDSIDDKTGFFTNFQDNDHGLTSIITIPLSTIQQLSTTSCVALTLPIPFTNSNVSLPCMTQVYQATIPSIFNIWQVVSFGLISYWICLDIYKMVKGFKDPNEDKVEVLDL